MKTNITFTLDSIDKDEFFKLVNDLGMNMSTAFNLFVKQSVRNQALPLDLSLNSNYKEIDSVAEKIMNKYDDTFKELAK